MYIVSANRAHVKFGRRFRHMDCILSRQILCMSNLAVVFKIHAPFKLCQWSMRAVLQVRYSRRIGRAHVKFGRRFRHVRPFVVYALPRNTVHVKIGRRFRHARPFLLCILSRQIVHMSKRTAVSGMYLWFVDCRGNTAHVKLDRRFRHALPFLLC